MINIFKKFFSADKQTIMDKEINNQPEIIERLIKKYITEDNQIKIPIPEDIECAALIASGSSYHCASIAAEFMRNKLHIYAQSYYASEMSLEDNPITDSSALYIFISQSGETADTNNSLLKIKQKTIKTICVTNTPNSTLYENTNYKVLINAGEEKSIASTKAMSAQLFCLFLIALKIAQNKGINTESFISDLRKIPKLLKNALTNTFQISEYAKKLIQYENAVILASGSLYPLAKEGALKIKETSYINTSAYPTGEFLHGHIAILNKKCALIILVNDFNLNYSLKVFDKIKENYKTEILAVTDLNINANLNKNIILTQTDSDMEFLFKSLIILQILACKTAELLNRNVDKPIGLSKIVR